MQIIYKSRTKALFFLILGAAMINSVPGQGDATPPGQVKNFRVVSYSATTITLTWWTPNDQDFKGVMLRYSTTDYPATPTDGDLALDDNYAFPNTIVAWNHLGLTPGTTYYYSIFTYDASGNYSDSMNLTGSTAYPPVISSVPETIALVDQPYTYDVEATDSDLNDVVTFSLLIAPDGMTIDPGSGMITWAPESGDAGDTIVSVRARDTYNSSDTQTFTLYVSDGNFKPHIDSTSPPADTAIFEGDSLLFTVYALDLDIDDTLSYKWLLNGDSVGESTFYMISTDYSSADTDTVIVLVMDSTDTASFQWILTVLNKSIPPQIIGPDSGSEVTVDSTLIWSASTDPDLGDTVYYRIEFALDSGFNGKVYVKDSIADTVIVLDSIEQIDSIPLDSTVYWRIMAFDSAGNKTDYTDGSHCFKIGSGPVAIDKLTAIRDFIARAFVLQNSPNPFNPSTEIRFGVPGRKSDRGQRVLIRVYDLSGRLVSIPVNSVLVPGRYSVQWNGRGLPSGVYIYMVKIGGHFCRTMKMVLK
jgi:hypothetical protein